MIIIENGIEHIVEGDYPDGIFAKHIKNKGTPTGKQDRLEKLETKLNDLVSALVKKGVIDEIGKD